MQLKIKINLTKEDDSLWQGGIYDLVLDFKPEYPHEPPKATCLTPIYHPNIDFNGAVCLKILREDWKPVLGINIVILGLIYLFIDPNPEDPLNLEAAKLQRDNYEQFKETVKSTLRGQTVSGVDFPKFV